MQETPLEVRIFRKEMHRNGLITRIRSCQISPFEVEDAFLAKQLWVVVVCRRNSLTLGTNSAVGDSEQLRVLNLQNIPKLYISMGWFYWIGTVLDGKHQVLYLQYVFWDNLQARRELTGHLWYAQGRMGDVVCPQTSKTPKNPRWIGFGDCYCGWFRMISMVSTCHLIYFYYIFVIYVHIIINVPLHYGTFDHTARVGVILFASQIQLVKFPFQHSEMLPCLDSLRIRRHADVQDVLCFSCLVLGVMGRCGSIRGWKIIIPSGALKKDVFLSKYKFSEYDVPSKKFI